MNKLLLNSVSTLPKVPTRDEILRATSSFQGLLVNTSYGLIPWFEGTIASFNNVDRQSIYKSKHAAGDKLCGLDISWNYAEPGQPYGSGNLVPPCDLTDDTDQLLYFVKEIISNNFYVDLRLAGDGQSVSGGYNDPIGWTYGYQWLIRNLSRIVEAVYDYRKFIIFCPGYDGVFYGWTPEQVKRFWKFCRSLIGNDSYQAIEYSTGVCHLGDGQATYTSPEGQCLDLIYQEFNTNLHDNSYWQVAARMLGPSYIKPRDDPNGASPYYLAVGTPRGKYYWNAFEWATYYWVRGKISIADINRDRNYLEQSGAVLHG